MIRKSAVILSGGKNTRMNYKIKAFLEFEGSRFIERALNAISDYEEKIISCNDIEKYREFKDRSILVLDDFKDIGPIGGIYSSLKKARFSSVLIVAGDMPFLSRDILKCLGKYDFVEDALIPVVNGRIQPLCGIYKKSILGVIEEMIEKDNYRLKSLLENINTRYIDINEEDNFSNINTVEEYNKLIRKESE
ncbi:molybdenum cofactor guanylyltransferase [Clostridium sardiniense]